MSEGSEAGPREGDGGGGPGPLGLGRLWRTESPWPGVLGALWKWRVLGG